MPSVTYFTGFSFMSAMQTFGLALIVVIFIEALVLQRREHLRYPEAFKLATFANVLSTLIGFCVLLTYNSSMFIILCIPLGVALSVLMARSFLRNTGYLQQHPRMNDFSSDGSMVAVFLLISIASGSVSSFLLPGGPDGISPIQRKFSGVSEVLVTTTLVAFLLTAGFVLTVISKGYAVACTISSKRPQLVATIVRMNLLSYGLLFGTLLVSSTYVREGLRRSYGQSERMAEESVEFAEKTFGPDHPNVAIALMNLAPHYWMSWMSSSHYPRQRALSLYTRALRIRENAYGPDHPAVAEVLEKSIEYIERTQPAQAKYRSKEETSLLESLRERLSRIRSQKDQRQNPGP